jgi:DUF1680 family protein
MQHTLQRLDLGSSMTNDLKPDFLTRREFMGAAAAGAAFLMTHRIAGAAAGAGRAVEHGDPLHEFGYGDVTLADGPHRAQLEQTHAVLMELNEDSLLRPFRIAAKLPAPGDDLGGWYSSRVGDSVFGPGTFGQWVSALSRYHAISRDEASCAKTLRLIEGFSKTVEPGGAMFAIHKGTYDSYNYDKLVIGLIDAHRYCGVAGASATLAAVTQSAQKYLPGKAIDFFAPEKGAEESYTLPENQFLAWQVFGDDRYLAAAKAYLDQDYLGPLAERKNVLPGRHAYSHANALSSAAKAYLVLGDEKYLRAAVNGLGFMEAQSYATGAWGAGEVFLPVPRTPELDEAYKKANLDPSAYDGLGEAILNLQTHFETPCGSYAHFKLTRYLLRITKDPQYGDSMERVMYNCVLGALPLNKFGKAFYQSNYSKYATKRYFDGYGNIIEDEWPCCSGSLPQLAADYTISAYLRDDEGVFVNLYIPSTVRWSQGGASVALTQTGSYPVSDGMTFVVEASQPARFALRFRIPKWAQSPTIQVNGKRIAQTVQPGSFATITRRWRSGDRIEVTLPKQLELKSVDDRHPHLVALVNGPIVLFAIGHDLPKLDRETLLAARQTAPASVEWKSGGVRFLPWWIIKDEIYTTYHDVS